MQPTRQTLAELFDGRLVYVVPSYQRLYVWNCENQWEPLWSDVEELANILVKYAISGSEQLDEDLVEKVEPHFLGAVVLKRSGNTPDLARRLRIIDGQQRLTTLQLLLAAAARELGNAGLSNPAAYLRELTSNPSRSVSPGHDGYKITHQRPRRGHNYEHFSHVMRVALNDEPAGQIDGPMIECYQFFQNAIQDWLKKQETHTCPAGSALATALTSKLYLVGIYLDTYEQEHVIFETLNARGEPLTEWDKIKNYLLYKAEAEPGVDQESFFENYLDRFDERWWREQVGRGVQSRPRADIFADYWLESRIEDTVTVRRVFREFQRHVDNKDSHLEPVIREFVEDARYFERFETLENANSSREALFHTRRLEMAIGAVWPLLLKLQRVIANQSQRDRWFAALESYFVRRIIVGYQARSYDRVALEILRALPTGCDDGDTVADTVVKQLLQYEEAGAKWPNDSEVRNAVLTRHLPQYAQRLVLSAIEQRLMTNWAGNTNLSPSIQVEHIMPRAWQEPSWPLPDSIEGREQVLERREQAIQTLGNLTLLNGPLNAHISNSGWDIKRPAIQKHDNLFLNRRLLDQSPSEWTEDDIRTRGEWMHGIILKIWPRG